MSGAAAAAAAAAGSSLADIVGNSILANSANAKSKRASMRELWMNKWLMDYQNEYNKPINQMKRLEEAGLNPNLVYGSGADTMSATAGHISASGITPSKGTINFIEKMSMLNAMKQQEANIDATNTNIDVAKADLELRQARTEAEIDRINATTNAIRADSSKKNFWSSFYQNPAETIGGFLENVGRPVVEGFWNFGRALGAKLRSDKPYKW